MKAVAVNWLFVILLIPWTFDSGDGKVLELSDRFLPLKHEGMWLIMFYAPWCGHCKKLEPIWKHVDQTTAGKLPVRVGRVDCTRFPNVANEFNVRGFPTVLFLKGDSVFTYEGDRTRDDIVNFATRLTGPAVKSIENKLEFEDAKTKSELFFLFAGQQDGPMWDTFKKVATAYQQHEYFYQASVEVAQQFSGVRESQTIRVYKDGTSFKYLDPDVFEADGERVPRSLEDTNGAQQQESSEVTLEMAAQNTSLYTWVTRERFPLFVKVTRGRFGHLLYTRKLLVMAVLEENKLGELTPDMEAFRAILQSVLQKNTDKYRPHFQFGWTGAPDLANSVAMENLVLPHLIVVNTSSYQHYLPDDDPSRMTSEAVALFLDNILEGSAPVYGGSSYTVRLYRAYFEARSNISEMWKGNPALTAVLFGLPFGFFSLICYSICCADIMDAEEEEDDSEYCHEKTD